MPPKRKRGGGASRGRRGRPPKKNLQTPQAESIASPALDINDTSSSSSPILEEQSQPDTKIKLETKIHKKFGIKYHVPDEVLTPKSISPNENAASSSFVHEASEESSSPMDENYVENMETESTNLIDMERNLVENDISEQFNNLEVVEEGSEMIENVVEGSEIVENVQEGSEIVANAEERSEIVGNVELDGVDLEGGVVLEYITTENVDQSEDEVFVSSENEIVGIHDESTEEVYYVVEESDEAMMEGCDSGLLEPKIEPVDDDDDEQNNEVRNDVIESEIEEHQDTLTIVEQSMEKDEIQMEVVDEVKENDVNEVIVKSKDKKKEKEEKGKILDKPCRKSTRISLRGARKTLVHAPILPLPVVDLIEDSKEEPEETLPESTSVIETKQGESQIKEEIEPDLSEALDVQEQKSEIDESLNESMESMGIAAKEPSKKVKKAKKSIIKPKMSSKEPKLLPKESKIKKDEKSLESGEERPKKSNKKSAVTLREKSKVRKVKESKSTQQSKSESQKADEEDSNIRRSSRIKTITTQKVRSKGKGLVKKDDNNDHQSSGQSSDDKSVFVAPVNASDGEHKPVKVKSRWRRSSELEMRDIVKSPVSDSPISDKEIEKKKNEDCEVEKRLKQFVHLRENVYLTERISCKEAKKMVCDCFLTEEEVHEGEYGCGDDCLNRLLMIECGNLCAVSDRCTNKRFQKLQSASVEAFCTDKKGLGIRAVVNIPSGDFILEYVGEVLDAEKFEQRAAEYSKDKNTHYYFMSLRADAIIDATMKGNISRFINHSCEPNAETQKWTVNGELRIGFFSKRTILAGEEITFDYQFQRYGKEAQKCYCEAPTCRGWLGEEPDSDDESLDDEEEEEEEEVVEEPEMPKVEGPELDKEGEVEYKEEKGLEDKETEPVVIAPVVKKVVRKEKPPRKERKPKELKPRFKSRIDRFEDLGLDEEIESLQATGLKNQAHTLKLSRLMVRAKEPVQRTKLLKLLKKGEFPCRRLFLDYHGLRLIHGWMTDALHLAKDDPSMENLRLDILQTLAVLPIPSKTMLQDSKVLPTVEKWSSREAQQSPGDSDSNSPKIESEYTASSFILEKTDESKDKEEGINTKVANSPDEQKTTKEVPKVTSDLNMTSAGSTSTHVSTSAAPEGLITCKEEDTDDDLRKSTGMDPKYIKVIPTYNVSSIKEELLLMFAEVFVPLPIPMKVIKPKPPKPKYDILVEIIELALKLLEEWSTLKEMFRIPKKERIEQMKEHEREADRRYKALSVEQETERKRDRYRTFQRPSRIETTDRSKDRMKMDRYSSNTKLSKYQRRELFARQVEQAEEEERRRKQQLWAQQKPPNWMMAHDPRVQPPYDPTRNMPCVWNPQIGQWQNIVTDPNAPQNCVPPLTSIPPPNMTRVMPNLAPGMPNIPHSMSTLPPGMRANMPPFNFPPFPRSNLPHMDVPHGIQPLQPGMLPPNVVQPNMPPANMGAVLPMPNIPPRPALPYHEEEDDASKVRFMGPIPPPAKLPPKWKCAKDKYGRPYYYHVKVRKAQWEPPECPEGQQEPEAVEESETSSSSDTSSLSSSSDSEDSDSEDDTKLMLEIRNKFEQQKLAKVKKLEEDSPHAPLCIAANANATTHINEDVMPTLSDSFLPNDDTTISDISMMTDMMDKSMAEESSPPEGQVAECSSLKRRRVGLVQELIISPRTEEDRIQFREDAKKYKHNKEVVRKQKEVVFNMQLKKQAKSSTSTGDKTNARPQKKKISTKVKIREMEANSNSEESKKIKESFRSAMAIVMVSILNPYRKPDCKEGRIHGTEDFKHLARKLTHFVMLKELKHCDRIEELQCTESVKSKAKEFVRKYMAKFGEVYQRPAEETDNF